MSEFETKFQVKGYSHHKKSLRLLGLKDFFICIPHKFKVLVDLVSLALMIVFVKKNAVTVTYKLLTHSEISVTPIFRGQQVKHLSTCLNDI